MTEIKKKLNNYITAEMALQQSYTMNRHLFHTDQRKLSCPQKILRNTQGLIFPERYILNKKTVNCIWFALIKIFTLNCTVWARIVSKDDTKNNKQFTN